MTSKRCSKYIDTFSSTEKILNRIGFFGALTMGAVAVFMESIGFGFIYVVVVIIGTILITRVFFCAYCPYPNRHETCLFFPYDIVRQKNPHAHKKTNIFDRLGTAVTLVIFIGFPQFWLWKHPVLLTFFWILTITIATNTHRHYCTRCRYLHCPLNRTVSENA
jgi:hypothetical protein